jgi:hypothetical protein
MDQKEVLRLAMELDEMTRDVLPEEADLLEEVLKRLKSKKIVPLSRCEEIKKLHEKYLSEIDSEDGVTALAEDGEVDEDDLEE